MTTLWSKGIELYPGYCFTKSPCCLFFWCETSQQGVLFINIAGKVYCQKFFPEKNMNCSHLTV